MEKLSREQMRVLNYPIELPFVAVDNSRGRDRRRQTDKDERSTQRRVDGETDTSAQRQWIH